MCDSPGSKARLGRAGPTRTADQRSRAPAPRTGQFQTEDWSSGILTLWSYYNFSPAVIGRGSAGSSWTTHTGCTSPSLTGLVSSARGRSCRWLRLREVWPHRVGACWTRWWSSLWVVLPFGWLLPLPSCASLLARTHTSLASELSVFVLRVLLIPRIRQGMSPLDEGRRLRLEVVRVQLPARTLSHPFDILLTSASSRVISPHLNCFTSSVISLISSLVYSIIYLVSSVFVVRCTGMMTVMLMDVVCNSCSFLNTFGVFKKADMRISLTLAIVGWTLVVPNRILLPLHGSGISVSHCPDLVVNGQVSEQRVGPW